MPLWQSLSANFPGFWFRVELVKRTARPWFWSKLLQAKKSIVLLQGLEPRSTVYVQHEPCWAWVVQLPAFQRRPCSACIWFWLTPWRTARCRLSQPPQASLWSTLQCWLTGLTHSVSISTVICCGCVTESHIPRRVGIACRIRCERSWMSAGACFAASWCDDEVTLTVFETKFCTPKHIEVSGPSSASAAIASESYRRDVFV